MTSKLVALSGAALALLMASSFCVPADARGGGGHGFGGGGHAFSGGHMGGSHMGGSHMGGTHMGGTHMGGPPMGARGFGPSPRFDHRRDFHRRAFIGAPFLYGDVYYYGNGCDWLRRNAAYTGSPYWWNRYYGCVNGYGY